MKYSLYNFIVEYKNNKHIIDAYLKGESIENYNDSNTFFGLSITLFVVILAIMLFIWTWAIWALVKYWKILPSWAKVLGVIGVIPAMPGGPILTLIAVYIGKQ